MNENKVEIKFQTKTEYYFELIKKWSLKIIKPICFLLILTSILYISFYVMLFFLALIAISYIIKAIKS